MQLFDSVQDGDQMDLVVLVGCRGGGSGGGQGGEQARRADLALGLTFAIVVVVTRGGSRPVAGTVWVWSANGKKLVDWPVGSGWVPDILELGTLRIIEVRPSA